MGAAIRNTLEMWGGVECSVVRIGNRFRDQLHLGGHAYRLEDLDRIGALGIRTLRFPILWERVQPTSDSTPDWRWSDARLARLQQLCVRPIVGLVHHGSGPLGTDLTSDSFVTGLTDFARRVAQRYPW